MIAVGRTEIALFDRLFRLQGRMSGPEAQQLHQQRLGRLCAAHHVEEAFGAPVGDAAAIDVETGGGDALQSGAVVDVEFCRAARQSRVALKVELAGGIVAAMAGDAAVVEDRLDVGGVIVAGRSRLRIGASNAAGDVKDHRRKQAIHAYASQARNEFPPSHSTTSSARASKVRRYKTLRSPSRSLN